MRKKFQICVPSPEAARSVSHCHLTHVKYVKMKKIFLTKINESTRINEYLLDENQRIGLIAPAGLLYQLHQS